MQIPILNGIYADSASNFRGAYPRNMLPVIGHNGISEGFLRPADGIVALGAGPGIDRGGFNWQNECYRVMGTKLVKISSAGAATTLGDVGGGGYVSFDCSFDYLAICSGGALYYWDGAALTAVVDPDLGHPIDMVWADGYFVTTDGEYLVVTDLGNPLSVNPLKYGSSEIDPDPIVAVKEIHNEIYAVNRYSVEVFQNIGGGPTGTGFPYQRIDGGHLPKGAVGTHACAKFMEQIAFVGSGRDEAPAVWMGLNGQVQRISSEEIERILASYTEAQLAACLVETRTDRGRQELRINLSDRTLVYDAAISQSISAPVWNILTTSVVGNAKYRAQSLVWCYDKWLCADPLSVSHGYLTEDVSTHWGATNGWDFATAIIYNEGNGALIHELELVALTGNVPLGIDPVVWASHSDDGVTWSTEVPIKAGKQGERAKRLSWRRQGLLRNWRIQRFRGTSEAHISFARLEAQVEPLRV